MKNSITVVNADFLNSNGLLSSILLEIFLVRYRAFKIELNKELANIIPGELDIQTLKAMEIRLKNGIELSLLSRMHSFAKAYDLTMDYHATIDFMEEYLIAAGEIQPINVKNEIISATLLLDEPSLLMSRFDPILGDAIPTTPFNQKSFDSLVNSFGDESVKITTMYLSEAPLTMASSNPAPKDSDKPRPVLRVV